MLPEHGPLGHQPGYYSIDSDAPSLPKEPTYATRRGRVCLAVAVCCLSLCAGGLAARRWTTRAPLDHRTHLLGAVSRDTDAPFDPLGLIEDGEQNPLGRQLDTRLREELDAQLDAQIQRELDEQLDAQLDAQITALLDQQLDEMVDEEMRKEMGEKLGRRLGDQVPDPVDTDAERDLDQELIRELERELRRAALPLRPVPKRPPQPPSRSGTLRHRLRDFLRRVGERVTPAVESPVLAGRYASYAGARSRCRGVGPSVPCVAAADDDDLN